MLLPPVTYQGGKQRLSCQLVEIMAVPKTAHFYDLCCGSDAVSLALVERGHPPSQITMIDKSPWGLFWSAVGSGFFNLSRFKHILSILDTTPENIKGRVEILHKTFPGSDAPYIFLILQAAAIGGKAVELKGGCWHRGSGYRDYWLPTATSSRQSPVNPMMPMPKTILERVERILETMRGVNGVHDDVSTICMQDVRNSIAYIDPPYIGTTGYFHSVNAISVAKNIGCPCWVSEGRALSSQAICLSSGRAKGGLTG